jgi:ATP-dependent DNA helicase RecQ
MAYSGETEHEERLMLEAALLGNQLKCLVATSALGMGFDKPDLGFVVHFQSPGSPIAYYQQIGRAGRALEHAPAVLLRGAEDRDIQDYFIRTAFPPQRQAEAVVALLEERAVPMSLSEILAEVNIRRSRLDAMLKILEVEGAIQREGGRYLRTLATWNYPTERVERVTAARRLEQAAMVTYGETEQCLMEFLRTQLDDPEAVRCGRCMNCRGERPSTTFAPALVTAAREFLRGSHLAIPPRRQWPVGVDRRGRVPTDLRCEEGRALSVYNDGGWGALVRVGKWDDGHYADELVEASAQLIIERWGIGDSLEWVTCVPSLTHPDLVPSFARRLAEQLGLPFEDVIVKTRETRPQKEMENSAQQYRNVQRAFAVNDPPYGAVLLVDDIVDSGWTLTVLGAALREAGVEAVYPFVLAKAVSE